MKDIHSQSHSISSNISVPQTSNPAAIATFCAIISPMIFGNNCTVYQGGIHVKNGICSTPDLLVRSTSSMVDYTVRIIESKSDVFSLTPEDITTSLGDSTFVTHLRGQFFSISPIQ